MNENGQEENTQAESEIPPETTPTGEDEKPELGISMGVENGDVIVVFSQRLSTLGLPPDAADQMADALKKHAAEAREMRAKAEG